MRFLFLLAALAGACAAEPKLTPEQQRLNIESFEIAWRQVRDIHWDLGRIDWQAVHDRYRPAVEEAGTVAEARQAMRDMLARLEQSHFAIIPAEVYTSLDRHGASRDFGRTGVRLDLVDGRPLVTIVEPQSPASATGIGTGWEVVGTDSKPLRPVVETLNRLDTGDRELMIARSLNSLLAGRAGTVLTIELLDGSGRPVTRRLERAGARGKLAGFGNLPPVPVWFESRTLHGGVGYIRFNFFLDPEGLMPQFEQAVRSFASAPGIVIDLRGNPGGIGAMAMGVAGWFVDQPGRRLGTLTMRGAKLNFVVNPRLPYYAGPLAILIDGTTASTSEIFAGGMQDLKRARIFGSRSAGAALPSAIMRLPNGDGFQYALAGYVSESGRPLEGLGVAPDVEVRHTRAALLEGRDLILEAAIDWIKHHE